MLYKFLIYLHVFSAILSIGPFFLLLPVVKMLRNAEKFSQQAYLNVFRFAVRLTKHAGHILVGSGILLVVLGPWSWKTPWIVATIIVMVSSLFFLARAFSPTIRKFDDSGQNTGPLVDKLKRSTWIYIILLLIMLWFMVTKPALWLG